MATERGAPTERVGARCIAEIGDTELFETVKNVAIVRLSPRMKPIASKMQIKPQIRDPIVTNYCKTVIEVNASEYGLVGVYLAYKSNAIGALRLIKLEAPKPAVLLQFVTQIRQEDSNLIAFIMYVSPNLKRIWKVRVRGSIIVTEAPEFKEEEFDKMSKIFKLLKKTITFR